MFCLFLPQITNPLDSLEQTDPVRETTVIHQNLDRQSRPAWRPPLREHTGDEETAVMIETDTPERGSAGMKTFSCGRKDLIKP